MAKIIYVYSTKGGVGKSTISITLAFHLKKIKSKLKKITLIDMDFSGPSIPRLIKQSCKNKLSMKNFNIIPIQIKGVNVSSVGFIKSPNEVLFLSGEYSKGAINQFLNDNLLKNSDIIIIDMPPGFGEFHRYIFTKYKGSIIFVTTPHFLSEEVTKRGITILKNLKIPILYIIQNMAYFICPKCKKKYYIFGKKDKKLYKKEKVILIPFSKYLALSLEERNKIKEDKTINNIFNKLALEIIQNFIKK